MNATQRKTDATGLNVEPMTPARTQLRDSGTFTPFREDAAGVLVDDHELITRVVLYPEEREHGRELRVVTSVYQDAPAYTQAWLDGSGFAAAAFRTEEGA